MDCTPGKRAAAAPGGLSGPAGAQFQGNEGFALRINEVYEHEAIRSCQTEETSCPVSGCNKVSTQCVDVSAPVVLSPTATLGSPTITCQGSPTTTCVTSSDRTYCTVTLTQQVCVSIPVCYGVNMATGDATISCADSAGGSCACRC